MHIKFRRRFFSLCLFVAFLAHTLTPFFAVYNLSAVTAETKQLASLFGEKILICTGDGFKWVSLADLQNGKENPKPHPDYKCPLCYVASHGLKAVTGKAVAVLHDYGSAATPLFAYDSPFISSRPALSLHVRAPPVSFIA